MFTKEILAIDAPAVAASVAESVRQQVMGTLRKRGAVVGLSGGIDSSVVAALCVKALGKERVLGIFMPERDSSDDALRLGRMLASHLGIEAVVEDIAPALRGLGCYDRQNDAIRQVFPQYGERLEVQDHAAVDPRQRSPERVPADGAGSRRHDRDVADAAGAPTCSWSRRPTTSSASAR